MARVALPMTCPYFRTSLPGAVAAPGWAFRFTTVLTLTTGGVFVMWLGEQITERGIGNGMSLLIFFSIIERILPETLRTFEALKTGTLSFPILLVVLAMMVLVVAGTVAVTVAARRIPVQIPRKVMGRGRIREGQKTFIPLRINSAGVMPIIFAQSLIIVPGTVATFIGTPWLKGVAEVFNTTSVWYILASAALIVLVEPTLGAAVARLAADTAAQRQPRRGTSQTERIVTRRTALGGIRTVLACGP